jgi:hypothetical protein
MRLIGSGLHAFRPFGRLRVIGFLISLVMTFRAGGGTPNSAPWLIAKFFLIGLLLVSLLVVSAGQVTWLTRRR